MEADVLLLAVGLQGVAEVGSWALEHPLFIGDICDWGKIADRHSG
jgi:hypothetical protein